MEFQGKRLSMDVNSMRNKAEELDSLVEAMANRIMNIDEEIKILVQGGLEGSAIESMATAYIKNREVISDYIRKFAMTAQILHESANALGTANSNANISG